jgi:hypothetical protein
MLLLAPGDADQQHVCLTVLQHVEDRASHLEDPRHKLTMPPVLKVLFGCTQIHPNPRGLGGVYPCAAKQALRILDYHSKGNPFVLGKNLITYSLYITPYFVPPYVVWPLPLYDVA